jgi:hypothetical protein
LPHRRDSIPSLPCVSLALVRHNAKHIGLQLDGLARGLPHLLTFHGELVEPLSAMVDVKMDEPFFPIERMLVDLCVRRRAVFLRCPTNARNSALPEKDF